MQVCKGGMQWSQPGDVESFLRSFCCMFKISYWPYLITLCLCSMVTLTWAESVPSSYSSTPAQTEYYNTRPNCDGSNPQFASDTNFHQMVLKWKAQADADVSCACPQVIEILWESAPNFSFQAHCTNQNYTYGPYSGTFSQRFSCNTGILNGSDCIAYSCPSTGGWTLSSDQQTCSRPDCSAGYERDPATGACLEPCPSGYVRNLSTMQCEIVCDSPLIRTPANTCDCPNPLTLIDGNACIGQDDKEMGDRCEASSRIDL